MSEELKFAIHDNQLLAWRKDDTMYMVHIVLDPCPEDPRIEWREMLTDTMACWHRRYKLGDELAEGDAKNPSAFWQHLLRKTVGDGEILDALEDGKFDGITVEKKENGSYNIYEKMAVSVAVEGETKDVLTFTDIPRNALLDYVIDDISISDCMKLLEPYAVWMPLWLYDHSGITMSCGERTYPYNDAWDSCQVGWIITMKDVAMKTLREVVKDENGDPVMEMHEYPYGLKLPKVVTRELTEDTWRECAIVKMKESVKEYDSYLRGEAYCFTLYSADPNDEYSEWMPDEDVVPTGGFLGDDIFENGMVHELPGFRFAVKYGDYTEGEYDPHSVCRFNIADPPEVEF